MKPSRILQLLLCSTFAACADPPPARPVTSDVPETTARHTPGARWMERGNWVIEWSSYTPREVVTADGKRVITMVPTPGASQHVRDADSPSHVDGGARANTKITVIAAADVEPGTIALDVGTVTERNVPQDRLEALAVAGDSARVYWTWRRRSLRSETGESVEVPFSTILIEGVHPGKTEIFLHWPDSVKQTLVVNVSASAPRSP